VTCEAGGRSGRRLDEGLAEAPRQRRYLRHVLAEKLAAGIDALAKQIQPGLDTAADAVASLQRQHVDAVGQKLRGRSEAAKARPDDDHGMASINQKPAFIFSNSAIMRCFSSGETGAWNSVLSRNFSMSSKLPAFSVAGSIAAMPAPLP
jgi:hypothetical protein